MDMRFEDDPVSFFPEWQDVAVPFLEIDTQQHVIPETDMSTESPFHAAISPHAIPEPVFPGLGKAIQRQDYNNALSITPAALLLARAYRAKSSISCPQSPIAKTRRGRLSVPEMSHSLFFRPGPLLSSPTEANSAFRRLSRPESTFLSQPEFPALDEAAATLPATSASPSSSPFLHHSDSARSLCPSTESESEARCSSWPCGVIRRSQSSLLPTISNSSEDTSPQTHTTTSASNSLNTASFRSSPDLAEFVSSEPFLIRRWPPSPKQEPMAILEPRKHGPWIKYEAAGKTNPNHVFLRNSASPSSSSPNSTNILSYDLANHAHHRNRTDSHVKTPTSQAGPCINPIITSRPDNDGNERSRSREVSDGREALVNYSTHVSTPTWLAHMYSNQSGSGSAYFVNEFRTEELMVGDCADAGDDACGTVHLKPQLHVQTHCQPQSLSDPRACLSSNRPDAGQPHLHASTPSPAPIPTPTPAQPPVRALYVMPVPAAPVLCPSTPPSKFRRDSLSGRQLTLTDMAAHFHLPAPKAAELLGVSRTCFNKVCRDLGVERWPFRKISCINKWIEIGAQVLQDPTLDALERDAITTCLTSLDDTRKKLSTNPNIITNQLLREIRRIFPFNAGGGKHNLDDMPSSP